MKQQTQATYGNKSNSTGSSQSTKSQSSSTSGTSQTVTYNGSRNNYLTNIAIVGYDLTPEFKKTNTTYFLKVANSVTSLTVTASKEDSTAVVSISGNTNLKVGLNKILISVLAKNGDIRYYRIYVTREG